ncbi:phosphatidate cytidylyltransferase [Cognatiluteimonas weifangensis]|uniref:Phosphatidate cytidylyltransferase n=1 Tax=Cognatiluteimonas weifangensis TaxID=2303539 RepID=A0A372DRV7_9GAMM|nr:phosphatidate cytidylyltransferase [Luteimonas weifangensis]RFP62263.1 phosphatidate cytidylyltransferase [Luteimonas weifangensis]
MTKTRVLAALVLTPLAIAAILLLPTPWLVALAAVVFLAGLWEWFRLADIDDTLARTVLLVANLALMVAIVWASRTSEGFSYVLLQIMVVLGVIWWLLAALWLKHFGFASDHATHGRVFKLAAGTLAIVPAWCALGVLHASQPNGHRWLFVALAIVWAADSGAYFVGRHYGRRKLSPRISPNKTVEGLFGGLVAGLAVALAFAPLAGATAAQLPAVALVALVAVGFSVIGDLFESLLKRHVGAKDSGDLIPGHGGILDRIDGVIAALPVFALGKAWLGF